MHDVVYTLPTTYLLPPLVVTMSPAMQLHLLTLHLHLHVGTTLHLPWNLIASRTPKYEVESSSWSEEVFSVFNSWDFPHTRDQKDLPHTRDEENLKITEDISTNLVDSELVRSEWLIPPSRHDEDVNIIENNTNIEVENVEMINNTLDNFIKQITDLWNKMPGSVLKKVKDISREVMDDAINTVENNNIIKTTESSGLFNSLTPVKQFLVETTNSLLSGQNLTDFSFSIPQTMFGGSMKINVKKIKLGSFRMFSDSSPYQEVVLPGFGIAQDYVNELIKVVLNTITVWSYKDDPHQCGPKFLCSANKDIFSRGFLIPNILTYLSSLVISFFSDKHSPSSVMMAARRGRKGEDCHQLFQQCKIDL